MNDITALTPEKLDEIRQRYSPVAAPKCHICGAEMTIGAMSASRIVYACSGATYDDAGCHYAPGRSIADDHYAQSRVTVVDVSDPDVLALVEALEATEKTSAARKEAIIRTNKMFQRERDRADAADKRVAELEKAATEPTMYQARMWNPAYDEWDSWEECNVNAFEVFSQEAERGEGMEVRKLYAASPTLESRAVTVKLPDINEYLAEVHDKTLALAFRRLAEGVRDGDIFALRAAGIQVIEGEGQ